MDRLSVVLLTPMTMMILMVFRRRSRLGQIITSVKKVVETQSGLTASTVSTVPLVNSLAAAAWIDALDANVPQYSHIYGLYLSLYATLDGAADASVPIVDWYISKNPGNNLTMPEPGATGGNDNRRWILHEGKGLLAFDTIGAPRKLFEGVIKIPQRMSKFSLDDTLDLRILTENHNGFFCVKAIYKFFR